jgi:acetyl esterase/lipase
MKIDLRLPPNEKPKPEGFPSKDPLSFLVPLFNSYASLAGPLYMNNPRLHPILAPIEKLPPNIFMVVAGLDILVHEQTVFYERLKRESESPEHRDVPRRIERLTFKKGFHGWLERTLSLEQFA